MRRLSFFVIVVHLRLVLGHPLEAYKILAASHGWQGPGGAYHGRRCLHLLKNGPILPLVALAAHLGLRQRHPGGWCLETARRAIDVPFGVSGGKLRAKTSA